ncbi:MAG: hypothetical protein PHH30_02950 [Bacteroidales bacterium]|nr:hypothetical protein [Bacteroidales bacterium]
MNEFEKKWLNQTDDEIYEHFDSLSDDDKFEFLLGLTNLNPLPEIDWIDYISDIINYLLSNDNIEKSLILVDWFIVNFPKEYETKYGFIERELINYFIYKKDWESVNKRIAIIKNYPVLGVDIITIRLIYQLLYNLKFDAVVEYCLAVRKDIADSDKLFVNPEEDFAIIIYLRKIQDYYETILHYEEPDRDKLVQELKEINFTDKESILQVLKHLDKAFVEEKPKIETNRITNEVFKLLNIEFMKYMYYKYKLPFVFSNTIFMFFANSKLYSNKKYVKNVFYFEKNTLNKHIAESYDNVYGTNNLEIFGKVWGMYYVFDFFHYYGLINKLEFNNLIKYYEYFRNEFIYIEGSDLWIYKFVFEWPEIDFQNRKQEYIKLFDESRSIPQVDAYENAKMFVEKLNNN